MILRLVTYTLLGGYLVNMAWCVLKLQMDDMEGSCEYTE
jgi:hypothetical protein